MRAIDEQSSGFAADLASALSALPQPLTPAAVLEAALDPGNPLHGQFEPDDAKASRLWRAHRAEQLIAERGLWLYRMGER